MTTTLFAILPFFALLFVGYLASRYKLVSSSGVQGLNTFVYFFALPALLFEKASQASIDKLVQENTYIVAYIVATASVFALGFVGARALFKVGPGRAALMGLSGSYSNIGFIAIPVLVTLIGDQVAVPLALIVLIDVAIFIPLATILIDLTRRDGKRQKLYLSLWQSVFKNPLIVALLAGFLMAGSGWNTPLPAQHLLALLGDAAAPVAMFALGAALAGRPISDGFTESIYITVFKLSLHPLAVWMSMSAFGIGADWRLAATLGCALPVATSVFVIAQEYNVMPARASTAILVSTIASIFTLTLTISYLVN